MDPCPEIGGGLQPYEANSRPTRYMVDFDILMGES